MSLANQITQDGYPSRLYGNDKTNIPVCPIKSTDGAHPLAA